MVNAKGYEENLYTENCIRTYSGIYINPFDPKPEQICIEDIAHALANICRFGGHTQRFYSVAEHCVMGSAYYTTYGMHKESLAFLLHDASEAYLGDIPAPLKKQMPEYIAAEKRLQTMIYEKFGVDQTDDVLMAEIKKQDERLLVDEWKHCVINQATDKPMDLVEDVYLRYYKSLIELLLPYTPHKVNIVVGFGDINK